jgi:hypothetical protein
VNGPNSRSRYTREDSRSCGSERRVSWTSYAGRSRIRPGSTSISWAMAASQ